MDRKFFLAIALSLGIYVTWTNFVMVPTPPDAAAAQKKSDAAKPDAAKPDAAKPDAPVADAAKPDTAKPDDKKDPAAPEAPLTRQPESFSTVEIAGRARATFSSWGGTLHDFVLLDPRHKERSGDHDVPIDLVTPKDAPLPFSITFPESGFELPPDADFRLEPSADANERRYVWESGTTRVEKLWQLKPGSFEGRLTITVENKGDKPLNASLRVTISGQQDPSVEPSIFKPSVVQTEGLCSTGKVKREALSSLVKEAVDHNGAVRVVAIDRKYFVLAAALNPVDGSRCRLEATKTGRIRSILTLPATAIAAGARRSWQLTTFVGPKIVAELDAARVPVGDAAEGDAHLGDVMNYGFTEIFARPMLWVLKTIYRGFGNWGIAIVLLTVLIKLITWWPTAQSMKSAGAMAKLKPEMDKLREKYGDDKQRMNAEVMALYQKHKINPLGGCLPALIQMPIYIALYSMLGNSIELFRSPLGLWIHDLTSPDPFFVLPLATGAFMFLQQKLSPTPPDPSQKTMMTMMPIMFTGMSIFLPAGLTLYILTNTVLSMVQQRISMPKPANDNQPVMSGGNAKKKAKS